MDRLDLTLDYLIDMTFDSHNYREWKDVPSEYRAAIAMLRKLIKQSKGKNNDKNFLHNFR